MTMIMGIRELISRATIIGVIISQNTLVKSNFIEKEWKAIEKWNILPSKSKNLQEAKSNEIPLIPTTGDEEDFVPMLPGGGDSLDNNPSTPDTAQETTQEIPNDYGLVCPTDEENPAPKNTIFYDLQLTMTINEIDLNDEASYTLRTELYKYINAYASCACPASSVYLYSVYRIESSSDYDLNNVDRIRMKKQRTLLRRKNRRLVSRGRNRMASPGTYESPLNVNLPKLISDSINRKVVTTNKKRLNYQRYHRSRSRNLQITDGNCEYIQTSFAKRLNETTPFLGIIIYARVEETTMNSCAKDENTCCNHISYSATCNPQHYDEQSLCQLQCCCNFPTSDCCTNIFQDKDCDSDAFCAGFDGTMNAPGIELEKHSVYFPGVGEIVKADFI